MSAYLRHPHMDDILRLMARADKAIYDNKCLVCGHGDHGTWQNCPSNHTIYAVCRALIACRLEVKAGIAYRAAVEEAAAS